MAVLHFVLVNSPLMYILFSLLISTKSFSKQRFKGYRCKPVMPLYKWKVLEFTLTVPLRTNIDYRGRTKVWHAHMYHRILFLHIFDLVVESSEENQWNYACSSERMENLKNIITLVLDSEFNGYYIVRTKKGQLSLKQCFF